MRRPRKYEPGEPFATLDELLDLASEAHRSRSDTFVWRDLGNGRGRPEHIFWTVNTAAWALVRHTIPRGMIRRAVVTDEYAAWLARESALVAERPAR